MNSIRKYIVLFAAAAIFPLYAAAQQRITGVVTDASGNPVEGVAVSVVGKSGAVLTDRSGVFVLDAEPGSYLEANDGVRARRLWADDSGVRIVLDETDRSVDNSGVKASQRTQTGSVYTIGNEIISKNSSIEVRDLLYGLIPGLISQQYTAWEGTGASLSVHGGGTLSGNSPLIVVDGVPRDISYLKSDEIESISVLKDGAATALWGTRGANGVIMVTTKRGTYSALNVDIKYTFGMGTPINQPEFVDGYQYALLKNEALHNDGLALEYDNAALEALRSGSNPELFPNVDWQKEVLRNNTFNHQFNLAMHGGGKKVRYYAAINYYNDRGLIDKSVAKYSERYTAHMDKVNMSLRLNLDADITKSTRFVLNLYGYLMEKKRPRITEESMFSGLYNVPAAAFPVKTSTGLWGSDNIFKFNPVAQIADVGYFRRDERMLQADMRILQDLSSWTKGLSFDLGVAYDNSAMYQETGSKSYAYETITRLTDGSGDVVRTKFGDDSALDITNGGLKSQFMQVVFDARLKYDRAFGYHKVNGTFQYRQESYIPLGTNTTRKYQSYIITAGYGYKDRYLLDAVVNFAGTSVLKPGDKFRVYPAVSGAWVISNEPFLKDSKVNLLKLRASWGRSGYDGNLSYSLYRQYWTNCSGYSFKDNPSGYGGIHMDRLPSEDVSVEYSDKYNVGVDFSLDGRLSVTADAYYQKRSDILLATDNLYSSVIGIGLPKANVGSVDMRGVDAGIIWHDRIGRDFSYYIGGTIAWQRSSIIENAEGYQPYDYLYKKGDRLGQLYGLEAIGYFRDEQDVKDSPSQMFSTVMPGDIKYKDQNGDGSINEYDVVAIGKSSSIPDLYYGIHLGFEIKGFAVDAVFQGVGGYSKMLNTKSVYWPLRNNNSNISKWYTEDNIRWTENTKDIANLPRLTTLDNANNFRSSTQWLVDASYFSLRNLSVSYTLPKKWSDTMKMERFQIFVRGNNLFSIDKVKYLNCDDLSVHYPELMSFFAGININF